MTFETVTITLLWITGGLALIIYPAILVANVMSFAAPPDDSVNFRHAKFWFKVVPFKILLIVTTLYPVLYFFCIRFSKAQLADGSFVNAILWALPGIFFSGGLYLFLKSPGRRRHDLKSDITKSG